MTKKRNASLDDGCNPELVAGARFEGFLEIPVIEKPDRLIIPELMAPFSKRNRVVPEDSGLCLYEKDTEFADVLIHSADYVEDFRRFALMVSPDPSLYRDAPLAVQITNLYRNRALGGYYQRRGCNVIANVRWGSEETYTTKVLGERIAFLGAPKHSMVSIGTYGCIKTRENKYHFEAGLDAMMQELEPEIVLVYGPMPKSVFGNYLSSTQFVPYPNWTKLVHGGE